MQIQLSITLALVLATVLISWRAYKNTTFFNLLKHSPYVEVRNKEYYRMLTSGFIHSNHPQVFFFHIFFNMFVLFEFGRIIEMTYLNIFGSSLGRLYFLLLYLLSIIGANLFTFARHKDNYAFASVGASGGVSGILFAFILFYPWETLYFFGIVPIPAIVLGVLYLVYSSYASRRQNSMIDHDAHFAGAVCGFVFTLILKPDLLGNFIEKLVAFG